MYQLIWYITYIFLFKHSLFRQILFHPGSENQIVTASTMLVNNVTNEHEIVGKMYPTNKPVSSFSEDQPTVREYMFTFSDKQSIRVVIQQQQIKQHVSLSSHLQ
jgi:hypothetical protein